MTIINKLIRQTPHPNKESNRVNKEQNHYAIGFGESRTINVRRYIYKEGKEWFSLLL